MPVHAFLAVSKLIVCIIIGQLSYYVYNNPTPIYHLRCRLHDPNFTAQNLFSSGSILTVPGCCYG